MTVPITPEALALAEKLWDYHHMGHALAGCDCILALGSHDLRVAERAAQLWLEGWAPLLILSGGLGNLTRGVWDEPEAERFAGVARRMGVPEAALLIENRSTNTGENIRFTRELLASRGLDPESFLVVQKPYMERRSFATFKLHWPDKRLVIASPPIAFADYPNAEIPLDQVIHVLVGDLQRVRIYPERGFQIPQPIPDEVWRAYERLVELGFTGHLAR